MSWLSDLLSARDTQLTFDQDLELFCARWQDRSRKGKAALTRQDIGLKLLDKAEQLLDVPPITSQGA